MIVNLPNIIIVAYKFCPRGRIGTRRWSKFAKFLSRKYKIHLICAKYPYRDKVNWCHDVENNPNINIYPINARFPTKTISDSRGLVEKVQYKILQNLTHYIDEAQYWKKPMLDQIDKVRKDFSVDTIIVTGAPFSPMHHIIDLRKRHADLKVVLDLRDPWMTIVKKKYGPLFPSIKKAIEERMEREAFDNANKIIFVSNQMKEMHQEKYNHLADKMVTVYNGFDEDDFSFLDNLEKVKRTSGFRMAYAGALHLKRAQGLQFLLKTMYESKNRKWWQENLKIDIYSNQVTEVEIKEVDFQAFCDDVLVRKSALPQQELFENLSRYDLLLTINDVDNAFAFGTKFFEYIALNKPVMLLSPIGEQYSLLKENGQYVSRYDNEECTIMLDNLKSDLLIEKLPLPHELKERFNLNNLSKQLLNIIH